MSASFPPLRVHFDDGQVVEFIPKARDMAFAERDYNIDYSETRPLRSSYATALAAMHRMVRLGHLDRDLPDSPDALMEIADLEVVAVEDPEGKDLDPAPTTG